MNSPDTTVLVHVPVPVSVLVLAPVTWGCNKEFVGYSAFVSLHQIDRTQQLDQQPAPGVNLRGNTAKVHQEGSE